MQCYDVFNGDADGICALHQLRLAEPRPAQLITGVKRDNILLRHLAGVQGSIVTVLDISLERNRQHLLPLLESCRVFYADHHFAGELPASPNLEAHIDPNPDICTALIIDRLLHGRYRPWAVVAAFGDNMHGAARQAASGLSIAAEELAVLQEVGELLNYNGYGKTVEDLFFHPADLYAAVKPFADPLAFARDSAILSALREGFDSDMAKARAVSPLLATATGRVYRLPGEPWARRVAGVFSNEKAREMPERAHALLVDNNDGTVMVSVRAPLTTRQGADSLCRRFSSGGGRAAAAGINAMPAGEIEQFFHSFHEVF